MMNTLPQKGLRMLKNAECVAADLGRLMRALLPMLKLLLLKTQPAAAETQPAENAGALLLKTLMLLLL